MKRILCLATLILLSSIAAQADIARPDGSPNRVKKPKSVETTMSIRLDRNASEATLRIPKGQIKQLRAELEQFDNEGDSTAAVASGPSFSRVQTIVSGMFLSLAMVFGGMWFVRSGKAATRSGKALVIFAVIAGVGSAVTFVYANAGPPAEARSITGKMFSQAVHTYKYGSGKIRIEAKNENNGVELIVPDPQETPKTDE